MQIPASGSRQRSGFPDKVKFHLALLLSAKRVGVMPVHREKQWEKYCGDENPRASETSVTEYFPVCSISFAREMRAVLMALLRLIPAVAL